MKIDNVLITKEELWRVFYKENVKFYKNLVGFVMGDEYKKMKRRFEYTWKKLKGSIK